MSLFVAGGALGVLGWALGYVGPMAFTSAVGSSVVGGQALSKVMLAKTTLTGSTGGLQNGGKSSSFGVDFSCGRRLH